RPPGPWREDGRMDLRNLVTHVAKQQYQSKIFTFEKGEVVARTHADVVSDVKATCAALTAYGVKQGSRVGLRAPNSYLWMIYDLALIELRAISVALTDDF